MRFSFALLVCFGLLAVASASARYRGLGATANTSASSAAKAAASTVPPDNADPTIYGKYEYLGLSYVVGTQLAAIPNSDKFFMAERPSNRHPDHQSYNAAYMDLTTKVNTNVKCKTSLENCAQAFTIDGDVAILAGHKPQSKYPEGRRGIRLLDQTDNQLKDISELQYGHWLATATRLPDGSIIVMSDSPSPVGPVKKDNVRNPFYELWDPSQPTMPTTVFQLSQAFVQNTKYFYYPFVFVLPTGDLFVWANTYGEIVQPLSGHTVAKLPTWSAFSKMYTQYPFSGTAVMLPLTPKNNYQPEILICGGQWSYGWVNTTAVDQCMRMSITIKADGSYTFSQWKPEQMPSPRVSHSAVLLPDGTVLLIGGAKRGLLGDTAGAGKAMLNDPNFWPVLYTPSAPEGSRFKTLSRTQIARLLHSAHGLTTNGTVFVAGCDRCKDFWSSVPYSPSDTGYAEYRTEIFTPPQILKDPTFAPQIVNVPMFFSYKDTVTAQYTLAAPNATVDKVVLIAPSSDTHTFNMHQRIVELEILSVGTDDNHVSSNDNGSSVTFRGPPDANIAPPGFYMLFLLSNNVWGPSNWIQVK